MHVCPIGVTVRSDDIDQDLYFYQLLSVMVCSSVETKRIIALRSDILLLSVLMDCIVVCNYMFPVGVLDKLYEYIEA